MSSCGKETGQGKMEMWEGGNGKRMEIGIGEMGHGSTGVVPNPKLPVTFPLPKGPNSPFPSEIMGSGCANGDENPMVPECLECF